MVLTVPTPHRRQKLKLLGAIFNSCQALSYRVSKLVTVLRGAPLRRGSPDFRAHVLGRGALCVF